MGSAQAPLKEAVQIEGALLRVPVEELKRLTRAQAKLVERELAVAGKAAAALAAGAPGASEAAAKAAERLRAVVRKVEELGRREEAQLARVEARVTHLLACAAEDAAGATAGASTGRADPESAQSLRRLDRLLAEHMHREGCHEAAQALAREPGLEHLVDSAAFEGARAALEGLETHRDLAPALAWCAENRARLKRAEVPLEFELRLQECVELCRRAVDVGAAQDPAAAQAARMAALAHVREHLVPSAGAQLPRLRCVMGLLAWGAGTASTPAPPLPARYAALMGPARWKALAHELRCASYKVKGLAEESALATYVRAGLASLADGTPLDGGQDAMDTLYEERSAPSRMRDDPLRVPEVRALARGLPRARAPRTALVCPISGEVMSEENPPMVLPNGLVYSLKALQRLADASPSGVVTCPRTLERYTYSSARKAFLM
mmetsp:Transcript_5095/g.15560  ORF Transcript_5095/g.15560 Transcript_5095/m.15560 type:complete len:437 (-) Transcript_5095:89-1399(-)